MKELTTNNFAETIKEGLYLVDFWAEWCGPCRIQNPILEELDKENINEKFYIGKVNVDENQELAASYGIQSIPTLMLFANGEPVHKMIGVQMKQQLKDQVNYFINRV